MGARAGRVIAQFDEARRLHRARAHREDAAESLGRQFGRLRTRTVSPLAAATRAASPASQAGVFRPDGMFTRSRASPTAPATARAVVTAAAACSSPAETSNRTSLGPRDAASEASENR